MFTTLADYQVVPYAIPDQTGDGAQGAVTPFIDDVENGNLTVLLGFLFYDAFVAALPEEWKEDKEYSTDDEVLLGTVIYKSLQDANTGQSPLTEETFWEAQPANRWTKLLAGDTYLNSEGKLNKWVGMKELCKPMVYAEFLLNFNDYVTSMGLVIAVAENAQRSNPGVRASTCWNTFAKIAGGEVSGLCELNSLFGYLYSVRADFNDVVNTSGYDDFEDYLAQNFSAPGDMNIFDL